MAKPALGRGLGALLAGAPAVTKPTPATALASPAAGLDEPASRSGEVVLQIPVKQIRPCPFQPRKDFTGESLRELADSIREQGIVQPLIVRQKGTDFELIAGERRWRAAELAGLEQVPVVVREADDRTVLELALIENLQRENLNPLEEALGFAQLIEQFRLTQEEAAARVGKSRAAVANALRLLKLPPDVQGRIRGGELSVGHAKVILGLDSSSDQSAAAERILAGSLNVRQTEDLVARWQERPAPGATRETPGRPAVSRDAHVLDLQERLTQRLGTKVALRYREGRGTLEIRFFSDAELERLLQMVGVEVD